MKAVWCAWCDDIAMARRNRIRFCDCQRTWIAVAENAQVMIGGEGYMIELAMPSLTAAVTRAVRFQRPACFEAYAVPPCDAWVRHEEREDTATRREVKEKAWQRGA